MEEPQVQPIQDEPVADATPATPPVAQDDAPTVEAPEVQPSDSTVEQPVEESTVEADEEIEYPNYQIPEVPQLDFSNMQAGDDGLIDPTILAGAINQQVATAEERAFQRAQQAFQEQQAETKLWEKAYEKYPDLKNNKELRDMVHSTRLGEVTNLLSRSQDPRSVKLPTPAQVADRFFKHIGTAKQEGMTQAKENTVIQASAHVETSGRATNDASDARAKAFQNINNPNKEVAEQARSVLLKSIAFGE